MLPSLQNLKHFIIVAALATIPLYSIQAKNTEVSTLTADQNIWEVSPKLFIERFANASWQEWQEDDNDEEAQRLTVAGLTFWGNPISAIKISESNGLLNRVSFEILDETKMKSIKLADFRNQAATWKKRLDEKFGTEGKRMATVQYGSNKHNRVAWSFENCIVILSANEGDKPSLLEFSCYSRDKGLALSKLKGQQLKDYAKNDSAGIGGTEPNSATDPDDSFGVDLGKEQKEIRSTIREIMARKAPKGIDRKVQDAVNLLNVYRYLSSVPYNVKASKSYVEASIDAAKICAEKGQLSHGFGHSTDKCNLAMNSGGLTMENSVTQYIEDSGDNNRERRGHRRWCLNHKMGKTGFGIEGAYSAMYSIDGSGKSIRKNYSYPGHGFYPIKYLHGNGWSYHLVEGKAPSDVTVEVWKLKRKDDKLPGWSKEPDGKKLDGDFVFTYSDTIVFEPQSAPVTKKGYYLVRIKGKGLKEQYMVKLF